jgi:hypothetical protein
MPLIHFPLQDSFRSRRDLRTDRGAARRDEDLQRDFLFIPIGADH